MASASDLFDGDGALSADHTVAEGSLARIAGELAGGTGGFNWFWNSAISWAANQKSSIIVGTYGADGYQIVVVRGSGSGATRTAYYWTFTQAGGNNADLYKVVNGATPVKIRNFAEDFGVPSPGQKASLEAVGNEIIAYIDDVEIFRDTDSDIPAGSPGCGLFRTTSRVASWEALDDAGGGGGSAVAALAYYRKLLGG